MLHVSRLDEGMKRSLRIRGARSWRQGVRLFLVLAVTSVTPRLALAASSFTYQGRLQQNDAALTGTCNMRFQLFDALVSGNQVGSTVGPLPVEVTGGLFTVSLDFGGAALGSGNRWLEIGIECPPSGGLVLLAPRQPLTAAPYAFFADNVAAGAVGAGQLKDGAVTAAKIANGAITNTQIDTATVQRRVAGICAANAAVSQINADGSVGCMTPGDIAGVTAGIGLTGGGSTGAITLSVDFDSNGSATKVARGDHDHIGDHWVGNPTISLPGPGGGLIEVGTSMLYAKNTGDGNGLDGESVNNNGVYGKSTNSSGVRGDSAKDGDNMLILGAPVGKKALDSDSGIFGKSTGVNGTGVHGVANTGIEAWGVLGESTAGIGVHAVSESGVGMRATTQAAHTFTTAAVVGESVGDGGIGVRGVANVGTGAWGVLGESASGIGVQAISDDGPVLVATSNSSPTGCLGVGGKSVNLITAKAPISALSGFPLKCQTSEPTTQFRVNNSGNVYAEGTFNPGGADFAEMLPGAPGLEAGDVLVIAADGTLAQSSQPRDQLVAGIYSTKPGFVGGNGGASAEADTGTKVPLAVVGVVPVKVTDESGPITPGSLLVTSSTPGHAMKADRDPAVGTVIGKALGRLDAGVGVISMLVVLQ